MFFKNSIFRKNPLRQITLLGDKFFNKIKYFKEEGSNSCGENRSNCCNADCMKFIISPSGDNGISIYLAGSSTITINYGDGIEETLTITADSDNPTQITHTYPTSEDYTITLCNGPGSIILFLSDNDVVIQSVLTSLQQLTIMTSNSYIDASAWTNLLFLEIDSTNNSLTNVTLPSQLLYLIFRECDFSAGIPTLPSELISLYIEGCMVNTVPTLPIGITNLYAGVNTLSSSEVNQILAQLVANGLSNGYCGLYSQTPAAPPTGQGLVDQITLQNNGWTIEVDP